MSSENPQKKALICPQCGSKMEVIFAGDLQDKQARCEYCDTVIDIPDSFERTRRHRSENKDLFNHSWTEEIITEKRSDFERNTEGTSEWTEEFHTGTFRERNFQGTVNTQKKTEEKERQLFTRIVIALKDIFSL